MYVVCRQSVNNSGRQKAEKKVDFKDYSTIIQIVIVKLFIVKLYVDSKKVQNS